MTGVVVVVGATPHEVVYVANHAREEVLLAAPTAAQAAAATAAPRIGGEGGVEDPAT